MVAVQFIETLERDRKHPKYLNITHDYKEKCDMPNCYQFVMAIESSKVQTEVMGVKQTVSPTCEFH